MSRIVLNAKVEDYSKWKLVFDDMIPFRRQHGNEGWTIFRNADDPNNIIVLWVWDTAKKAREYFQLDFVREAMKRAGTLGATLTYLDEVEEVKD